MTYYIPTYTATFLIYGSTMIQDSLCQLHKAILKFNYYHYVRIRNAYIVCNVIFLTLCIYTWVVLQLYNILFIKFAQILFTYE